MSQKILKIMAALTAKSGVCKLGFIDKDYLMNL